MPKAWAEADGSARDAGGEGGCLSLVFIEHGPAHIQEWIHNVEHMRAMQLK